MTETADGPLEGVVPAVTDDPPMGLAFPQESESGAPTDEGDDTPESPSEREPAPGG